MRLIDALHYTGHDALHYTGHDALHYTGHDALHYTGHDALHYTGHDAFQNSKASPYTLKVCIFVKFSAILKVHLRNIS
jgi:hypothetical protein